MGTRGGAGGRSSNGILAGIEGAATNGGGTGRR